MPLLTQQHRAPCLLLRMEKIVKRIYILILVTVVSLVAWEAIRPAKLAIIGAWDCDGYQLEFAENGRYAVTSNFSAMKVTHSGTYSVIEPTREKQGSIETTPQIHPLSRYKYFNLPPSRIVDTYFSFKGLVLFARNGELLQCRRPAEKK